MEITYEDGKFGPGDKKIFFNGHEVNLQYLADMIVNLMWVRRANGLESIDFMNMISESLVNQKLTVRDYYHSQDEDDLCTMAIELYKNEERIHPRSEGQRGGQFLQDFLEECMMSEEVSEEILDRYGLPNRID